MILQLLLGSFVISLTVAVHVGFIVIAIIGLTHIGKWLVTGSRILKLVIALIAVTLWILASHGVGVWIWGAIFLMAGAFETLEPAIYFSVVSFTTLGFGDITLPTQWRVLSETSAANGLILFGLSTVFLVEFISRLRQAQLEKASV